MGRRLYAIRLIRARITKTAGILYQSVFFRNMNVNCLSPSFSLTANNIIVYGKLTAGSYDSPFPCGHTIDIQLTADETGNAHLFIQLSSETFLSKLFLNHTY